MYRLSLAALLVLSLSVSGSWAAPALSGESAGMIAGKSNIYYEAEYQRGQQQLNYDKNNRVQQQGCLTSDNCSGDSSSLSKRQEAVSGQPETLQGYGSAVPQPDTTGQQHMAVSEPLQHPQNGVNMVAPSPSQPEDAQDGQEAVVPEQQQQDNSGQPSSQPQQAEAQSQPQPQPIPQQVQANGDDDDDDDSDNDDDGDNENKNQVAALPSSSSSSSQTPAQPVAVHQPIDLTPISNNDEVPAEGNGLYPRPTPLPPTPTSEPPINDIPSPTTTTTTTAENNTPTPSKSSKMSNPLGESAGDTDGDQDDAEESQPSGSSATTNKPEQSDSTGHEYQDGLTVTIEDKDNFCLMLPKSAGDQNIGESEKSARAFCTKEGLTPGAQMMPEGFIKDPVFKPGSSYVQVTGTLDIAAYQLSAQDGGGQYDDHGAGSPPGSHCKNYPYYVSLIEPDQNRFCIRCCNSYKNCNAGRSEYGCDAVLRDE